MPSAVMIDSSNFRPVFTGDYTYDLKPLYDIEGNRFIRTNSGSYKRHFEGIPNGMTVKVTRAGHRSHVSTTHKGRATIRHFRDENGVRKYYLLQDELSETERDELRFYKSKESEEDFDFLRDYKGYAIKSDADGKLIVREYKEHAQSRLDNKRRLRQTFQLMRDMVNTNFSPADFRAKRVLWITLTYREEMQDPHRVMTDFEAFKKRLQRAYKDNGFSYLVSVEAHGGEEDGRLSWHGWHLHVLLKFQDKAPFIPTKEFANIWRLGNVEIKLAGNGDINDFGAYLTAYMTDASASVDNVSADIKTTIDENGNEVCKAFKKGMRLMRCPPRMRLFRWSKDLQKPQEFKAIMTSALRKQLGKCIFSQSKKVDIKGTNTSYQMLHAVEHFNLLLDDCDEGFGVVDDYSDEMLSAWNEHNRRDE